MTNWKLISGCFLVCYCFSLACNNENSRTTNSDTVVIKNADTTIPVIEPDQVIMARIDSSVTAIREGMCDIQTAYFLPNVFNDTLKTTLFTRQGRALRIQYSIFEDSGNALGNNDLYFDDLLGIVKEIRSFEYVFYEYVGFNAEYICFRKSTKDGAFKKIALPVAATDGHIGHLLRTAHDLIQLYPQFKFTIPDISLRGDAQLKVFDTMTLYEAPDTNANKVGSLAAGSKIGFIRSNDKRGSAGGKEWIWYLVKTDSDSGWIVGHPDFVQDLTDENAED